MFCRMTSSKGTLTVSRLLCYTFVFVVYFHVFSDGFTWIQTPAPITYAEIGKRVTLRWHYNLSITNESHYQSDLIFHQEGKEKIDFANRQAKANKFTLFPNDFPGMFRVNGTDNVSLILLDVPASLDGSFCFGLKFRTHGNSPEVVPLNCTKLITFAYPVISFSPKDFVANVSDRVSLYCNATGKPVPNITWTKTDDPLAKLPTSNRFNLTVNGSEIEGSYVCQARNIYGMVNKTFFITVQYKPQIEYISEEQIIVEGSTTTLFCNASGKPTPSVEWTRKDNVGGTLMRGQNGSAELQLDNVTRSNAGQYVCTAKNILGTTSSASALTVQYKPYGTTLIAEPGRKVMVSGTMILNCNTSAIPQANVYKFYHNNSPIHSNDGIFRKDNISRSDGGEYRCVPSNDIGEGEPANVTITVLEGASFSKRPVHTLTINETQTIELRCEATGNPPPVITWTKDKKPIGEEQVYKKTNASRHDSGVYLCTANNSIGNPVHAESKVVVQYAPEIKYFKKSQTVDELSDVSLYCNASSEPDPSVQWFKGSVRLATVNGSVLLEKVTWREAGKYSCTATNLLGKVQAISELTVHYRPINTTITTNTGNYEGIVNETFVIKCIAYANPPTTNYTLYKNISSPRFSKTGTFSIMKYSWSPPELYTCIPENILGKGPSSSVNITYYERPSISKRPVKSLTVNETDTIKIECFVMGKPHPNVTWTKDGTSKPIGNEEVFTKANATRSDAGTYRCTAKNAFGQAEAEVTVKVNYKPVNTRLVSMSGKYGVAVNEILVLNCSTQAFPPPHLFKFFLNGSLKATSQESTFIIHKNQSFYDGNYTCMPINKVGDGEISNVITITMFVQPYLSYKISNTTVNLTDTITLRCHATGKPPPIIRWTKEGSSRILHEGPVYKKSNAERCDAGIYRCTADNDVKESVYAEAALSVNSLPETPEILNIATSSRKVEIHWEQPTKNCSLAVTEYVVQARKKDSEDEWIKCRNIVQDSNEWSCSFPDLESGTSYNLQIFAKNRVGLGKPAEKEFRTKRDPAGSSDASKGGLSKQNYIILGACGAGGLLLLIIILLVCKKARTKHEASFQTHIELNPPLDGGEQRISNDYETPHAFEGPMTASQETLEIIETREYNHNREDKQEVKEGEENKNNGKDKDEAENRGEDDNKEKDKDGTKEAEEDKDKNKSENVAV